MERILVRTPAVTLLGGGEVTQGTLEAALDRAPCLVAADSGADAALRHGHLPVAVIGDFDSISAAGRGAIPADRQHLDRGQNDTDFEKCLGRIAADLILAVGFLGGRVDHELAVFAALAARPDAACIVLGAHDVAFRVPGRLRLDLPQGTRMSLFPMGTVRGRSTGLRWPIDGLDLHPAGRVGTSNVATGPVTLALDEGPLLAILPARALDAAIAALAAAKASRAPVPDRL